jgi:S-adenosylmethionine decarboxylase
MSLHEQPVLYSADLAECAALTRLAPAAIAGAFSGALRGAGATIVLESRHAFEGGGLTCVLILQESHAVVHTWPETGTVNIDIFSCSSRLKSLAAIDEIGRLLGASRVSVQEVPRADGHFHAATQSA